MKNIEVKHNVTTKLTLVAAACFSLVASAHAATTQQNIVVADARDYRHCHNQPRRTYCHKKDRLPAVWPPFSDRQDHRKWRKEVPCDRDSADCTHKRERRSR